MKIRMLFVDYSGPGEELMPNLMLAVDEYLDEGNPSYWNEHFENERTSAEESGYAWRVFEVDVNENVIRNAFTIPVVKGTDVRVVGDDEL